MPGGSSLNAEAQTSDYRGEFNDVVILPHFCPGIKKEEGSGKDGAVMAARACGGFRNQDIGKGV